MTTIEITLLVAATALLSIFATLFVNEVIRRNKEIKKGETK